MRRALARLPLLALALLTAACVYHPSVADVGGIRIRPENGRAVRQGAAAAVYFDLNSTGKFGDILTGALSPVARQAQVVGAAGPVARLEIPGTTTVSFGPGTHHVVLTDLTRALVPGESIIVTLLFEKSGGLGVVTVVE